MNMLKNKKCLALLVSLLAALLLASCGGASKKGGDGIPISIGTHPYIHALPNFHAENVGLFDGYDISATIYSGGPTQNEAISSHAWEVGTTGIGGGVLGIIGYNMKVIGIGGTDSRTIDIWVRPDSPLLKAGQDADGIYGKASDWRGLKILSASGTPVQMVLIATLNRLGLSTKDVQVIDMSVAQSFPAFLAGEADVVCLWSPFGIYAEREGWVKVSSAAQLGVNLPILAVATEKAVAERPEMVQEYLRIYLEASEMLEADHALASEMLFDYQRQEGIRVDEDSAKRDVSDRGFATLEWNKELFTKNADGVTGVEEAIIAFAQFLVGEGMISEADLQKLIDSKPVVTTFIDNIE